MVDQSLLQQNVISILGLEKLPDEQKLALLDKMSRLAQKRIAVRILDVLKPEAQEQFMSATTAGDEAKVQALLNEQGIDIGAIIQEEVVKLKEEMRSAAAGV